MVVDSAPKPVQELSPKGSVRTAAPSVPEMRPSMVAVLMAAPTVFEVENLDVFYGAYKAVRGVNMTIRKNQITAFIGPSGCGKTTVLRCLNRMNDLIPGARIEGKVSYHGVDLYAPDVSATEVRRRIGMVFQKPNPFPTMSIKENVLAGPKLVGQKIDDKDQMVETSLRRAGLWNEVKDRLHDAGGALSGGQQQRLCIARSLAVRPEVLLMDEPCSALDPTSTRRIEETIRELSTEVTIVIVTHNMQQAARVSQQCAFFLAEAGTPGGIVEYGSTEQMFGNPRDKRTEDYVNGRFG